MFKKTLLLIVGLFLSLTLLAQGEAERVFTLTKILPDGKYSAIRIGGKNVHVSETFISGADIQFEKGQGIVCTSVAGGKMIEHTFYDKDFKNKKANSVYSYYFGSRSGSGRSITDIIPCPSDKKQGNEKRLALIVANKNYLNELNLPNTFNDMDKIKSMLLDNGFDVICLQDQTLHELKSGINDFVETLEKKQYDVSFFYYAGHGVQNNENDYIVPTDANLSNRKMIPTDCLLVNDVIDVIQGNDRKQNIILVDACREVMMDTSRGFGKESAFRCCDLTKQTSVIFSTSSTRIANDGVAGQNGPFVSSLIENCKKYSSWAEIAARTVYDVERTTRLTRKQTPIQLGTVNPDFVFKIKAPVVTPTKLTLSKNRISLRTGESFIISATVSPLNASKKNIVWDSRDPGIVSVSEGKITAIKAGTGVIVASCGNVSEFCLVIVEDNKKPMTGATTSISQTTAKNIIPASSEIRADSSNNRTLDYLHFITDEDNCVISLNLETDIWCSIGEKISKTAQLEYSYNGEHWLPYSITKKITLSNKGDRLYFRSAKQGTQPFSNGKFYYHFCIQGKVYGKGNIMSLIDSSLKTNTVPAGCFYRLFQGCSGLLTAPILPATSLNQSCYSYMFSGCSNLESTPDLPALVLAPMCYNGMFQDCSNLTKCSDLPAREMKTSCYFSMFSGCSNLTKSPDLPAIELAEYCYSNMFFMCIKLKDAPRLPSVQLEKGCYRQMFSGCSSLTASPYLGATKLALECYYRMFAGCTNLTNISVNFKDWGIVSYDSFYDLHKIEPCSNWVENVGKKGTFYCPKNLAQYRGESRIPKRWKIVYQ